MDEMMTAFEIMATFERVMGLFERLRPTHESRMASVDIDSRACLEISASFMAKGEVEVGDLESIADAGEKAMRQRISEIRSRN